MPTAASFPIHTVAERTGLNPHLIRAWERRYQAVEPGRSPGRHRLYSEAEIQRLALLRRAVECGHSIGQIARLPDEELNAIVARRPPPVQRPAPAAPGDPAAALRTRLLHAVERFDAAALESALTDALVALGHNGLLRMVVAPLAEEIGERWRSGLLTVAHEHFFTASAKVFLGDLARQFATPLAAPRMVVSTPAGQLHELGALMAAATAANLGWRTIYLGPNLPAHEIAGAALRNEAAAVALSIVYPEDDPNLRRELADLARLLPASTRIMAGGRAASGYFDVLVRIGALYAGNLDEFASQLDGLRSSVQGPALRA